MTNEQVLKSFILGKKAHTTNLMTDGIQLVNYSTTIAIRHSDNSFSVNNQKYSPTTSKIQNKLKSLLNASGFYYELLEPLKGKSFNFDELAEY